MELEDIDRRFKHHPPRNEVEVKQHEDLRTTFRAMAHALNEWLPDGREKSLVITHLEEALMWANAALARGRG